MQLANKSSRVFWNIIILSDFSVFRKEFLPARIYHRACTPSSATKFCLLFAPPSPCVCTRKATDYEL